MKIGAVKFWFDRWKGYVGGAQFVMVIYLFVRESGYSWWWVLLGFVLSMGWMWVDMRFIFRREMEAYSKNNPEWNKLMDRQ